MDPPTLEIWGGGTLNPNTSIEFGNIKNTDIFCVQTTQLLPQTFFAHCYKCYTKQNSFLCIHFCSALQSNTSHQEICLATASHHGLGEII